LTMTTTPNAVIPAEEPKRKKRGGKLRGNRSHQGSGAVPKVRDSSSSQIDKSMIQ